MPPRARDSSSSPSTTNPPASKKPKTITPPPPPSPSASYFFEDGNIFLHVGSTLFKVHRGVLRKSEVFENTLLIGSAGRGDDGGIPTIKLHDEEEDWELFLKAMYDGL